jgi:uncharacterized protein (DUF4415 family)
MPPDRTDWARVRALTDADIAKAVADDPDAAPLLDDEWFKNARIVMPPTKCAVHIKLDDVVVSWFKRSAKKNGGRGYQTQINAVLRAFVDSKQAKPTRLSRLKKTG